MQLKPEVKPGDEQTDNLKTKREEAAAIAEKLGKEERPDFLKDGVDTLPAYRGPVVMNTKKVGSGNKNRSKIYKAIGIVIFLGLIFLVYLGIRHLLFADGTDITKEVKLSEEEIASDLGIKFKDDDSELYKIPRYTNAKMTVRAGDELNIVYANGKQVGVNTCGRKYKLFEIGINEPGYNVTKKMTFEYDDVMMVLNDMFEGNTEASFYRNYSTNECFVVVVSKSTNRVIGVTYYNNLKKMTENLESLNIMNQDEQY